MEIANFETVRKYVGQTGIVTAWYNDRFRHLPYGTILLTNNLWYFMANLKSGLILGEDEHLVVELEAELWATSSNPIARLFGAVVKFINLQSASYQ